MDLTIKWGNGSMTVHLKEFLSCRNISKVKKLVKLIHQSVNPDDIGKVRMFIEQEIEQFEPRQKEDVRYIVGYREKVKFSQKQIDNCTQNRSRFKKNSDGWKHYNELVKSFREENRELKAALREKQKDFDDCSRNKIFYQKCLEIIS